MVRDSAAAGLAGPRTALGRPRRPPEDNAASAAVQALHWPSGLVAVCDDEPAAAADWVPASCTAVEAPAPPSSARLRTPGAGGVSNRTRA